MMDDHAAAGEYESITPLTGGERLRWVWERHRRAILAAGSVIVIIAVAVAITVPLILIHQSDDDDGDDVQIPFVITTWNFTGASDAAWAKMMAAGTSLDAVEAGCNHCELNPNECEFSVGFGGHPNEEGETTLDAMIMWAKTREVGSVACLKRVKPAISVARKVMEKTFHTLLVGDDATHFALQEGFQAENLTTNTSQATWKAWVEGGHIPNFWKGPHNWTSTEAPPTGRGNHDTIGMVAIDNNGDISCGASTNGLQFKIAGRVGDTPIPGSGAYCDNDVGGAAATGDGDVMMRFAPTRVAVQLMKRGYTPQKAASEALAEIARFYPKAGAAMIVVNKQGQFGAARVGYTSFPFVVRSTAENRSVVHVV